jgi:octaprenyl-diphosphate synthase
MLWHVLQIRLMDGKSVHDLLEQPASLIIAVCLLHAAMCQEQRSVHIAKLVRLVWRANTEEEARALGIVVPLSKTREPSGGLTGLMTLVEEDMGAVNRIILDKALSDVDMIPELAHHLIDSGGKRLRPMLTIAAAKLVGYEGKGHVTLAATVEFMHTATLLHDDVVDDSDMRRGKKTARLLWGNQASVLVGDFLLGQAFRMMVTVGSLPALRILSNAAAVIAEGEVMQLAAAKDLTTTEDAHLAIINAKTAALFSAAGEVGAAIAERPTQEQAALKSYGKMLGIAFQLVDDALDYAGDAAKLGKSVGDDFREGKITLPVILAYRRGDETERAFWERVIAEGDIHDGDLDHAMGLMQVHKTIEATMERARHYGTIAKDELAIFPDCEAKTALLDVVDFCIGRAS